MHPRAGVAELVDAQELKILFPLKECRFDSDRPHHPIEVEAGSAPAAVHRSKRGVSNALSTAFATVVASDEMKSRA